MDCFNLNINDLGDKNYVYPIIGFCGLCMTYLGNMFVRPTIFTLGTILSMGSSYRLTELIMDHFNYDQCLVKCSISVVSGFSGGFLLLKLYKLTHFVLGFVCGGSFGYLLFELIFYRYHLGIIFGYDTVYWLSIGIPGVISGLISSYKEKELSIMTTTFIGPMLLIVSFYHFTHYYNLVVYIPVYIGMSCSGLYIQYMKYKKDKLQINYDGVKT